MNNINKKAIVLSMLVSFVSAKDFTLYGLIGAAGMNTGYKNITNDDKIATGAMYDLNYNINGQKQDYDVKSILANIIYKF